MDREPLDVTRRPLASLFPFFALVSWQDPETTICWSSRRGWNSCGNGGRSEEVGRPQSMSTQETASCSQGYGDCCSSANRRRRAAARCCDQNKPSQPGIPRTQRVGRATRKPRLEPPTSKLHGDNLARPRWQQQQQQQHAGRQVIRQRAAPRNVRPQLRRQRAIQASEAFDLSGRFERLPCPDAPVPASTL